MKTKLKFILVTVLTIFIGVYLIAILHEQVHIQIFNSYGVGAHMDLVSTFPNLQVIPDRSCPTDTCILANNINEAIGYTAQGFLAALGILLLFYRISFGDLE